VTVFQIKGVLDATSSEKLEAQAQDAVRDGTQNLLLDLGEMSFLSSAGLRAIHSVFMLLRSDYPGESDEVVRKGIAAGTFKSPHLKLLKPSKDVRRTLELAGFDMFLEIYSNRKKALASF
jgi:anti-anti-sigma regulatory factor